MVIIQGKYAALDKLERLHRFWSTGDSGLPEEDRLNQFGREIISKWQNQGLSGGRRALGQYLQDVRKRPQATGAAAAWERLLAQNPGKIATLAEDLITAVQAKGFEPISLPGVEQEIVDDLVRALKAGMLEVLVYTNDPGEVPSIEFLGKDAGPFPTSYIHPEHKSALCVFTTNHFGAQDVIHIYNSGIQHATLVDIDAEMLGKMKSIYPAHWTFVASDFRDFLRSAVAERKTFDVVTSDPPYGLCDEVVNDWLGDFVRITRRILYFFALESFLRQAGYDGKGTERLEATLVERVGTPVKVLAVMHRNLDIYWVVVRVN